MNRPLSLLIVDNNLADQEIIKEVLPIHGLSADCTAAIDGAEALSSLGSQLEAGETLPDCVLVDLHLGRMHGRDLLARLRDDARLRHLPVIILTTAASEDAERECLALGAIAVLTKPLRVAGYGELAATIRRACPQAPPTAAATA